MYAKLSEARYINLRRATEVHFQIANGKPVTAVIYSDGAPAMTIHGDDELAALRQALDKLAKRYVPIDRPRPAVRFVEPEK